MSLKANIEVAVNFSWVRILEFHKIGYISYRMALFYRPTASSHPEVLPFLKRYSSRRMPY